jgi:hypothetical protein
MQGAYNTNQVIPAGMTSMMFSIQFGDAASVPVPADYDGDGIADIAIWSPSAGIWHVRNQFSTQWGLPGDIPVVAINR